MLRPFSFPLEQVRSLRSHIEAAAKAALARELATAAEREDELRQADEAVVSARGGTADGRVITGSELAARQAFLERCERQRAAAELAAIEHEQVVAERVSALQTAAADREVLDRLKERHQATHAREVARAEEATLGEVALFRHTRSGEAA